ncbi:MAG TPA: adenosine deaminase [Terriglobia bacterium]|nr:adenosine deaminase [Terriglobia bacterium]
MPVPKDFIAKLPKAELHLHLEGSLRPETLRELSRGRGGMEPKVAQWIVEREQHGYRYPTFAEFIEAFKFVVLLLDTPEDYALATVRLIEWLAGQNVKYAEITLAAGVILWKQQPLDRVYEAVRTASLETAARLGIKVNWVFDAVRQFGSDHAREVLRWASRYCSDGVVAFGLGGDEKGGPARLFTDVYREARDTGLHTVAHAGETAGPESVRDTIELLNVERIGHGLAAARDPEVMALLRDRAIPLEGCPGSNVSLGLVPEFRDYPLPAFLDAGITMTLNSDDPALFGTSIGQEFTRAAAEFALSPDQTAGLCENAVRAAFLPEHEKETMLRQIGQAVVA